MIFNFLMTATYALVALLTLNVSEAKGKMNVITTLPDFAEAARTVGGEFVDVTSLLKGTEDPHFLDAVPSYISALSRADVILLAGLDLEVGWLPKVLAKSGNSKVQPGGSGYLELGKKVKVIELPSGIVDRSMGDVHAFGNPHFNLSPIAMIQAGKAIQEVLSQIDPSHTSAYTAGYQEFEKKMNGVFKKVKITVDRKWSGHDPKSAVIEYHKEFSYFFDVYGIKTLGSIEEKPGVPPSAARLAEVASRAKLHHVNCAIGALFSPEKVLEKFSELSGIAHKKVPSMVQVKNPDWDTIEKVQEAIASAL